MMMKIYEMWCILFEDVFYFDYELCIELLMFCVSKCLMKVVGGYVCVVCGDD